MVSRIGAALGDLQQVVAIARVQWAVPDPRDQPLALTVQRGHEVLATVGPHVVFQHPDRSQQGGQHLRLLGGALTQLVEPMVDVLLVVELPRTQQHPAVRAGHRGQGKVGEQEPAEQPLTRSTTSTAVLGSFTPEPSALNPTSTT